MAPFPPGSNGTLACSPSWWRFRYFPIQFSPSINDKSPCCTEKQLNAIIPTYSTSTTLPWSPFTVLPLTNQRINTSADECLSIHCCPSHRMVLMFPPPDLSSAIHRRATRRSNSAIMQISVPAFLDWIIIIAFRSLPPSLPRTEAPHPISDREPPHLGISTEEASV